MTEQFQRLGVYSDWVAAARQQRPLSPPAAPGPPTRSRIRELLGFADRPAVPDDVREHRTWTRSGLVGEEVSWSVGYGPRTIAWVLRPAEASRPLPGVLALHSHDGYKYYGKEKIADGPGGPVPELESLRASTYAGRAFAGALAARGFVVLVHDVFLWGSRRFPVETMPESTRTLARTIAGPDADEVAVYNAAARDHEHQVSKYCSILGTTLAGVVAYEDRVALQYLHSRSDVLASRMGSIGLSGGGARVALLQATSDEMAAAVIVGMMTTYQGLLDDHLHQHTWMLIPPGLAAFADWPDLAASAAPTPLLVQFNRDDDLFSLEGMRAAHRRVESHYRGIGHPENYRGEFYAGPHKFDVAMQDSAFDWLATKLST